MDPSGRGGDPDIGITAVRFRITALLGTTGADVLTGTAANEEFYGAGGGDTLVGGAGNEGGDPLPDDLAQLQPFDAVILGNVPKDSFTESQQKLLEANVHDMGSGLIMLGGDRSFGRGRHRSCRLRARSTASRRRATPSFR